MTDGVHSPYQMCIFGKKLSSCLHYKQGLDKRFKSVLFLSLSQEIVPFTEEGDAQGAACIYICSDQA